MHMRQDTACNLQGKVRDIYDLGDKLVVVTTDRQSAFDRLLAHVPFKVLPDCFSTAFDPPLPKACLGSVPLISAACQPADALYGGQGQVLNLTSAWWMQEACKDVPNSLLAVPHPNVAIMARCQGRSSSSRRCSTKPP